jgi:DNA processing protein
LIGTVVCVIIAAMSDAEKQLGPSPAPLEKRVLSDVERLDWLRLIRSENIGPLTFQRLLARFGSVAAALEGLPELVRHGGRPQGIRICTRASAEREVQAAAAIGARLVAFCEPDYPPLLAHIDGAPPVVTLIGDARVFARPPIAIVGTRNMSLNGRRLAETLARDLGAAGMVVVSGLARGIDTAAHRASLASGTVAVVAGGVDVVYPPENRGLQAEIAESGIVISEMPVGTQPQARHFPRRNRLISGIAGGVIVVEAALRSGSLITARLALEQGRDVFAVPGSPLDARARGGNDLLRQGAILTESAEDVLRELGGFDAARCTARGAISARPFVPADPIAPVKEPPQDPVPADAELATARRTIAEAMSPVPATVDEIIRNCQLSPAVVTTVLLEWELAGRLERHSGNRVALIATA